MMVAPRPRRRKPSTTVRARVPAETAKRIRRLAKEKGTTESELIREALDLLDRRERRARAVEALIGMIPDKVPTKDEYAARLGKW